MVDVKALILKYRIMDKKNVIGYSNTLVPKIVNGKQDKGNLVVRIYVSKKEPMAMLNLNDLIPCSVVELTTAIQTDIVEIGAVTAPPKFNVNIKDEKPDKTKTIRPVRLGLSVGHWEITAGSIGMIYKDKNGKILIGSNAHVLTNDPSKSPEQITEKRICQCGPYHDSANKEANVAGTYVWHKQIYPTGTSPCPVGNNSAKILNIIPKIFGRRGRFHYTNVEENKIDFAVYEPLVEHIPEVLDGCMKQEDKFIGHLFGGSETIGVICKVGNILTEGYEPVIPYTTEINIGDKVKGCSFWEQCYTTEVTDTNAVITVNYGNFIATFSDMILVKNDNVIRGGFSGSGWRLVGG
jgi:hypothetical protein